MLGASKTAHVSLREVTQRFLFHRWSTGTGTPTPGKTTVLTGVSLGADDKNQLFLPVNDGTMKQMAIKYPLQETNGVEFPIPK